MDMKITLGGWLEKIKLEPKNVEGTIVRRVRFTIAREFDDLLAQALGTDAKKARESLKSRGIEKVVIPIDRVAAQVVLDSLGADHDEVTIGRAVGIKAVATVGDDVEDEPVIALEFGAGYDGDVWGFVGRNAGTHIQAAFTPSQQAFGFAGPVTKPSPVGLELLDGGKADA